MALPTDVIGNILVYACESPKDAAVRRWWLTIDYGFFAERYISLRSATYKKTPLREAPTAERGPKNQQPCKTAAARPRK